MLRQTRNRRWLLNALVALLVLTGLLWTSAAVLAQSSFHYSLGCWSIASGGGGQRVSTTYRMLDAVTPVGGDIQSTQFRIRANHYVPYWTINPVGSVGPAPVEGAIFMPIVWGNGLMLQNLCK